MFLRRDYLKTAMAIAFFTALLLFGLRGRSEALSAGRFEQLRDTRKALETVLKSSAQSTSFLFGAAPGAANPLLSNPQFISLRTTVKSLAQELQAGRRQLSRDQLIEARLAEGIVSLAEGQFSKALGAAVPDSLIDNADDQRSLRWLNAEAYFGLNNWNDATSGFRQLTAAMAEDTDVAVRLVDCLYRLGQHSEVFVAATDLLSRHLRKGDQLALREQLIPASEHYQSAASICSRLLQQEPSAGLIRQWAHIADRLADTLVLRGETAAAIKNYDQAIEAWNRLLNAQGRSPETLAELASTMHNQADALFLARQLEPAIQAFGKAAEIEKEISTSATNHSVSQAVTLAHLGIAHTLLQRAETGDEFYGQALKQLSQFQSLDQNGALTKAIALNNRGCVRKTARDLDGAIADFNFALESLKSATSSPAGTGASQLPASNPEPELHVELAIASNETDSEMIARTRFTATPSQTDLSVMMATIHRNLGYALKEKAETTRLFSSFEQSVALYRDVVDRQGENDLALQYAKSLCALAWTLASNPSDSMRDSIKAKDLALKACVLTQWKSYFALDSLAVAFAESGNFSEAIKYQTQALELAPAKHKPALQSRLNLYRTGKRFREGVAPGA